LRTWARSALAPRNRLLPGLGERLGRHPRLAAAVLVCLRHVPGAPRHVSRPLIQRMATRLELPVSTGFRIQVDTAEPMGRVLATSGIWEPHVTAAFRALLSPGDVCVDVGAYIGYYTLLAADLVGPQGYVYALEPAAEAYAELVANLELNGLANVMALRVAGGAAKGEVVFDDRTQGQAMRSSVAQDGTAVPVRSVASLVPASEFERLRLVKIDVEGYELEVLRGVEPIFETGACPAVLVELHTGVLREAVVLLAEFAARYGLTLHVLADGSPNDPAPWRGTAIELAQSLESQHERHVLLVP